MRRNRSESGAAAVEFAFALMGLMVFFAIFVHFSLFIIAHERLSYAGFAASRDLAVHGHSKALETAREIEPLAAIEFNAESGYVEQVVLTRKAPMFSGIDRFLTGGAGFPIRRPASAFNEQDYMSALPDDDNSEYF